MFTRYFHLKRANKEEVARQIFAYQSRVKSSKGFNTTVFRTRYADPMMIALALQSDPGYTPEHLRRAKTHEAESLEIVAKAAARAFQIDRLDEETGEGATMAELIGLVDAFDLWCFQLQKKT